VGTYFSNSSAILLRKGKGRVRAFSLGGRRVKMMVFPNTSIISPSDRRKKRSGGKGVYSLSPSRTFEERGYPRKGGNKKVVEGEIKESYEPWSLLHRRSRRKKGGK